MINLSFGLSGLFGQECQFSLLARFVDVSAPYSSGAFTADELVLPASLDTPTLVVSQRVKATIPAMPKPKASAAMIAALSKKIALNTES